MNCHPQETGSNCSGLRERKRETAASLPWALSVLLEIARQERSVLRAGDKRLLRESNDVALISNQIGNYEILKLIFIRLKCMCISLKPPKRCTWILTCQSVWYLPLRRNTVMMWWWNGGPATSYPNEDLVQHLRPDSTVWPLFTYSIWPWLGTPKIPLYCMEYNRTITLAPTNEESAWAQWEKNIIGKK